MGKMQEAHESSTCSVLLADLICFIT